MTLIGTRHHSSKSHGSLASTIKTRGGTVSSRHSSALKKTGSVADLLGNEGNSHVPKQQIYTLKFSYSDYVTRAFRKTYKASQFGPPSAVPKKPPESSIEISQLSEIYSDFKFIMQLLESNHRHIDKIRSQLEAEEDALDISELSNSKHGVRLPKLSTKNPQNGKVAQRRRSRAGSLASVSASPASTLPKLPPIT